MSTMQKVNATADFFTNEDSSEFHYVGLSEFGLWKRFNMIDGPEALVRPLLIERRSIADRAGYNKPIVDRVFRYADPGNPFGITPNLINSVNDYHKVNQFLDMLAEYNFYADFTCGDSQKSYMIPAVSQQQQDLDNFTDKITRFCFVETCNEPFKNGELPQNGIVPKKSEWYLRDSGYYNEQDAWEDKYNLDFVSYHGGRQNDPQRWPKWVIDLDDSISNVRTNRQKPVVLKEPNKFGIYYNDPSYARCLGLRANMGGVTFHSQLGLESNGYDDVTKLAAYEFFRGVIGAIG